MPGRTFDHFMAQAASEERLAATSVHRGVKARHEGFAAEFRASAIAASSDIDDPMFGAGSPVAP